MISIVKSVNGTWTKTKNPYRSRDKEGISDLLYFFID